MADHDARPAPEQEKNQDPTFPQTGFDTKKPDTGHYGAPNGLELQLLFPDRIPPVGSSVRTAPDAHENDPAAIH